MALTLQGVEIDIVVHSWPALPYTVHAPALRCQNIRAPAAPAAYLPCVQQDDGDDEDDGGGKVSDAMPRAIVSGPVRECDLRLRRGGRGRTRRVYGAVSSLPAGSPRAEPACGRRAQRPGCDAVLRRSPCLQGSKKKGKKDKGKKEDPPEPEPEKTKKVSKKAAARL